MDTGHPGGLSGFKTLPSMQGLSSNRRELRSWCMPWCITMHQYGITKKIFFLKCGRIWWRMQHPEGDVERYYWRLKG